jgi:hypothetical protein
MTHAEKIEAGKMLITKASEIDSAVTARLLDYDCELLACREDAYVVVVSAYGHTLLDVSPQQLVETIQDIQSGFPAHGPELE